MPVPSPRNPIRPARGDYADLSANILSLYDGELVYAIDQDRLYVVENGTLVPVGGAHSTSDPLNFNIQNAVIGESLNYDGTEWRNGGVQDGGAF